VFVPSTKLIYISPISKDNKQKTFNTKMKK